MLGRLQNTLKIQRVLARKNIHVTLLEAYDSWIRYSLSKNEEWALIKTKDKDETIYRRIRRHIQNTEEPIVLLEVKDSVKEKISYALKELDNLGKQEVQRILKYKNLLAGSWFRQQGSINVRY